MPGDVLRLNRASILGSRDFTLRAGDPVEEDLAEEGHPGEGEASAELVTGRTDGLELRDGGVGTGVAVRTKRQKTFLDERLFTVRAVVTGTETEPLRIKEKTKQRQRRVKHIKSKHSYTMLKITEVTVHSLEELDAQYAQREI